MAFERERHEPIEKLCVGDASRLEELRVHARRGEAGDRVDLVDDDLAVGAHEEVDAGHPLALGGHERVDGESAHVCVRLRGDASRDDEIHPALVVLRRIVVPVRVRDDLADDGRDRVAVAQNSTLDLDAVDALLDQDLVVVPARELDGGTELLVTADLGDADRRAETGGLHEHRVVEVVCGLVSFAERDVACDGNPAVAENRLEEILVHAQRRRGDTRADVGHASELEEALHRAVLSERAVQDRQHDVDLAERGRRRRVRDHRKSLDARLGKAAAAGRELPATALVDLDDDGVVALGIERGHDRPGRRKRDLVFARTAAREHSHANA